MLLCCAAGGAGGAKLRSLSAGAPTGSSIKVLSGGETGGLKEISGGATGGLKDLSGGAMGGFSDIAGESAAVAAGCTALEEQCYVQLLHGWVLCARVHKLHAALLKVVPCCTQLLRHCHAHRCPDAANPAAAAAGGETGGLSHLTGGDTGGLLSIRVEAGVTGGLADIIGGHTGGLSDIQTEGSAVGRLSDIGPDPGER